MYRAAADRAKPKETVIRVLDLGSDKLLPYFPRSHEDNPSLGRRGIRLLLEHPEVLRTQLRAILRLSATHPVAILFPMIGDAEELLAAKAALEKAKAELALEGQPFNRRIRVGAMIETPSAVIFYSFGEGEAGGQYYDSQTMANMLYPQTLLAYEMNYQPLRDVHGAPLRLRVENQLGFKMVKWISAIEFAENYRHVQEGQGGAQEDHVFFDSLADI